MPSVQRGQLYQRNSTWGFRYYDADGTRRTEASKRAGKPFRSWSTRSRGSGWALSLVAT
jgi:hypothetical protein